MPQADEEPAPKTPAPEHFEPPQNPSEKVEKEGSHDDHEGQD